jgi:hypothetical protein
MWNIDSGEVVRLVAASKEKDCNNLCNCERIRTKILVSALIIFIKNFWFC